MEVLKVYGQEKKNWGGYRFDKVPWKKVSPVSKGGESGSHVSIRESVLDKWSGSV